MALDLQWPRRRKIRGPFLLSEVATLPAEETPTLVTQEETPPEIDATPAGDAGLSDASSDAAPAPDTAAIEAEADAWLSEQESKGSEQQAPEPEPRRGVDPAVANAGITELRRRGELRQGEIKAREQELIDLGIEPALAKRMVKEDSDRFNSHHADALNYVGYEAAMNERAVLVQAIASSVPQSIQTKVIESLKPAEGQPNPPIEKVLKAFIDAASADAEAKGRREGRKEGFIAGRSQGERTQSSARSGQQVQGDPGGGGMTLAQWNALGFEGRERARRADPNIESKIR